jgi:protein SCO1
MSRRNLILILACVVGLAILGGAAWRAGVFAPDKGGQTGSGTALVGGPFKLVNQDGQPVDESILKGKWSAVFFGFTYCPDVCPTTLQALGAAQQELGGKADKLQVVFISVDPERDTPEQIKTYLSNEVFPKGTIGLTGTPEQIAAVAKAYRVYFKKNGEGDDYLIDHSTAIYLMNPKGQFETVLRHNAPPAELAQQISQAIR